jgi:hypothetical protein
MEKVMAAATCIEPALGPGVIEHLRQNNAEAAFQTASELARSCFTAMRSLNVRLVDDPDVMDRLWVILDIFLPESYSLDLLERERLRFHEKMVTRVPLELNLLFGLSISFMPE